MQWYTKYVIRTLLREVTHMINEIEKGVFLSLFNRNGYVLNFSTASFDVFTSSSIGIALCAKYGLSKGKSLAAFCEEANEKDVFTLFSDLIDYYETYCISNDSEKRFINLYERCKQIVSREKTSGVYIEAPAIFCVNRDYIKDIAARAMKDVENGDCDSAITKSRTLLEEVFCYAIESQGGIPTNKGKIRELYNQVKDLYSLRQTPQLDRRVNELLSGLEKVLSAISDLRNEASDSHGVGTNRFVIEDYHARLFVNASMAMSDYVLSLVKSGDNNHN